MITLARILVLDDEADTKDLFLQKFRHEIASETYSFTFACDFKEAMQMFNDYKFDIFITDINISGIDNIDFISSLKSRFPLMRTIVVSSYGDINTLRAVMRAGAHDFVIKPIEFADMCKTIENTATVVTNLKKAEFNNKKLTAISDELNVSADLQRSMLPGNYFKQGSIELWADTIPAAEVGGDFYDFFWLNDKQFGIVMADVSGKNVSAAMFALIAKTLIKSFSKIYNTPAECFKYVNQTLCEENATMMFVTAMYGIIDIEKNEITYTNAGHLPIALVQSGKEMRFLDCDSGIALGIMPDADFQNNTYKFVPGDMIMMYTDGIPEAADVRGQEFDNERFAYVLNKHSSAGPRILTDAVIKSIKEFTNGAAQSDDITTLCVKYRLRMTPNVVDD